MFLVDHVVFTADNRIARLSEIKKTAFGKIETVSKVHRPAEELRLCLVRSRSLGNMIGFEDMVVSGKRLVNFSLRDRVTSSPNLTFGTKTFAPVTKSVLSRFSEYVRGETEAKLASMSVNLLALDEEATQMAYLYLRQLFWYQQNRRKSLYFFGPKRYEAAKIAQVIGWKMDIHSTNTSLKNLVVIQFYEDDSFKEVEIDRERNQVRDQVVEIKLIKRVKSRKLYKLITKKGIEIIPTVTGMIGVS